MHRKKSTLGVEVFRGCRLLTNLFILKHLFSSCGRHLIGVVQPSPRRKLRPRLHEFENKIWEEPIVSNVPTKRSFLCNSLYLIWRKFCFLKLSLHHTLAPVDSRLGNAIWWLSRLWVSSTNPHSPHFPHIPDALLPGLVQRPMKTVNEYYVRTDWFRTWIEQNIALDALLGFTSLCFRLWVRLLICIWEQPARSECDYPERAQDGVELGGRWEHGRWNKEICEQHCVRATWNNVFHRMVSKTSLVWGVSNEPCNTRTRALLINKIVISYFLLSSLLKIACPVCISSS